MIVKKIIFVIKENLISLKCKFKIGWCILPHTITIHANLPDCRSNTPVCIHDCFATDFQFYSLDFTLFVIVNNNNLIKAI